MIMVGCDSWLAVEGQLAMTAHWPSVIWQTLSVVSSAYCWQPTSLSVQTKTTYGILCSCVWLILNHKSSHGWYLRGPLLASLVLRGLIYLSDVLLVDSYCNVANSNTCRRKSSLKWEHNTIFHKAKLFICKVRLMFVLVTIFYITGKKNIISYSCHFNIIKKQPYLKIVKV